MIDDETQSFTSTPQEWLDYFQMYKKLVDGHVIPNMKFFAAYGKKRLGNYQLTRRQDRRSATRSTDNTFFGSLKASAKLEAGPYLTLPDAKDSGMFYKPAIMLFIGKNTLYPQESTQLINFLLNGPEGISAIVLQRGVPLSQVASKQLMDCRYAQRHTTACAGI
ncbi:MAG: hypothetical protein ACSLEN_14460 [Candidatus Malihini olakiniferum]